MSREVFNSNMEFLTAGSRLGLNMGESQLVGRVIMSVSSGETGELGAQLGTLLEQGGLALTSLTAPTPGPKPDPPCLVPAWR